jgi:hypothetical protein
MSVPFPPELSPTKRSFQQGRWPTKRFVSMNGSSTTRIYGDHSTEASLDLEFLVDDNAMESILACFRRAEGAYQEVVLTDAMFDGTSNSVFPDYLKWHWVEAPAVSSVQPDLSRVTVKLIGLLEA